MNAYVQMKVIYNLQEVRSEKLLEMRNWRSEAMNRDFGRDSLNEAKPQLRAVALYEEEEE